MNINALEKCIIKCRGNLAGYTLYRKKTKCILKVLENSHVKTEDWRLKL